MSGVSRVYLQKFEINIYMVQACSIAMCSPYIVAVVNLDIKPKSLWTFGSEI